MTAGGWFIMIVSVGSVSIFFFRSLYMVFTRDHPPAEHIHSTFEETPDMESTKRK